MTNLLDEMEEEGRLEDELKEFISSHCSKSIFTQYEEYGVGADPAASGLADALGKCCPETRKHAYYVAESLFNQMLTEYVSKGSMDFDALHIIWWVFDNLSINIDLLLTAVKKTDKDFEYQTTWYYQDIIYPRTLLFEILYKDQKRAAESQKSEIVELKKTLRF